MCGRLIFAATAAVMVVWASLAQAAGPPAPTQQSIGEAGANPAGITPPKAAVITNPTWLKRPSADDLGRAYPAAAMRAGVGGTAKVECRVSALGLLEQCQVIAENPPGLGFGAAALILTPYFAMRPQTVNGVPVGGVSIVIPMKFESAGGGGGVGSVIHLLKEPVWSQTPTAAQVAAAFPRGEVGKVDFGYAMMRCKVKSSGLLADCDAFADRPVGGGFNRAALKLSDDFKLAVADYDPNDLRDVSVDIPVSLAAPGKPAPKITAPQWVRSLDPASLMAVFPRKAIAAGVSRGRGVVKCRVTHEGRLADCQVISETPEGLGFGEAVLKVADVMAMNPWTSEGAPVDDAIIQLPMTLALPSSSPPPPVVSNPVWSQAVGPGAADLMEVYPERAHRKGLSGAAKIKCVVTVEGTLDQCAVVEETPPDEGFGKAALRLSPYFRFHPRIVDGVPTGGATVVIPIRFHLPLDLGSDATHLIKDPVWASQATSGQIAAAFPRDRLSTTDEERVTLQCRLLADGAMGRCTTTEDDPSFKAAAQSLAKYYRVDLAASEKQLPDETYVDLHIQFKASAVTVR